MQRRVEEVVLMAILDRYPTPEVEKHLSVDAHLVDHLCLSSIDIYHLALDIESRYHMVLSQSFHIPDDQVAGWRHVQDIINTVKAILCS